MADCQYPWQIAKIARKTAVLGIDAQLYTPTEQESKSPLEMHSGFSRYVLTIIDSGGNKPLAHTANIPAGDIAIIAKKTELAIENLLGPNAGISGSSKTENELVQGVAYTVRLIDKAYKGRTPAEILIANPAEKDGLLRARKWLQDNLTRYPGNQQQIEAINEAVALLDIGELTASDAPVQSSNNVISIYLSENKYFTAKDDEGRNKIYNISITCDPTRKYPFMIQITNCYAPVEVLPDGRRNIKMSAATGTVRASMSLSDAEWYGAVSRMVSTMQHFEALNFPSQFEKAKGSAYQHV